MSTHPNAMLLCTLIPNGGSRKTFRDIAAHEGQEISDGSFDVKVGGRRYSAHVMESDYDESYQISAAEGNIVLHTFLTYGYGEKVPLHELNTVIEEMQQWAALAGARHDCTFELHITANYW